MTPANTYLGLLVEFGTTNIPVVEFAKRYLAIDEDWAKKQAQASKLPFPCYRLGGQKSPWLVDILEAAKYIDKMKDAAQKEYKIAH